ncbi:iron chelate uptake ABC transporter family permease subunit [Neisseria meningitidis]|uniref:iron chelate uptake ABC transporter family permease subunit n=1 Tax=Neisseria meningitidis TaxID=487 RepID=UPI000FCB8891|nr:iron chelate uptake ABC transporter family permease subunit [Neisseria meningitidis]
MPSEKNIGFMAGSSRPLWVAFALLLVSCVLFMTLNVKGDWDFVLHLRLTKLAALLMVAYAVGVSTQLFQTLTNNPILTPSILVFTLGGVGYTSLPAVGKFGFELAVMMGGSLLLFYTLVKQGGRDLSRMILIGVIFGILFRSLSSLLSRMIDPEEFTATQANMFASFNTVHSELLGIGAIVLLISAAVIWRERHRLDVYLLGRNQAINLGINYTRNTLWLLLWIAALVATATAVVGPVSFFGLLVAALANHFSPSVKHSVRLPMTVCVGGILLVGGQTVFEHFLGMKAVLSVVVEFAGGLVFLYLVLKHKK